MGLEFDRLREGVADEPDVDQGLRRFLLQVYLKVAGGLALSAAIAWAVVTLPALSRLFFVEIGGEMRLSGWGWALVVSPVLLIPVSAFTRAGTTARGAGWLYWTVSALVGGSLSLLAIVYAGETLISAFLVTASVFVALGLWGSVTRRNLSGLGHFLTAALFGLIVALCVNLLTRNSLLELVLDVLGVLIFSGLVATDTQRLKLIYYHLDDPERLGAASNYGALSLYLNFINLFERLLALMGGRPRR